MNNNYNNVVDEDCEKERNERNEKLSNEIWTIDRIFV